MNSQTDSAGPMGSIPGDGAGASPAALPAILIIDDREDLHRFCVRCLGDRFAFARVASGKEARALLESDARVEAALVDRDFSYAPADALLGPPDQARDEGLHILRWLRQEHPAVPVLMVTGYRDQQVAMNAADLGADFLAWEDVRDDPGILAARLQRALDLSGAEPERILARFRALGVVAESPAFMNMLIALHQAMVGTAPILLLGETGTGKDTLAFAVHALSGDSSRNFVYVNIAALNSNLIESELFGHERGAYTGAHRSTPGKMRYADGGTLFLNEIGELPLDLQVKLLTALERKEVLPVGAVRTYPTRFRLITATSRDLGALVREGRFRPDLFHRIAWHTITLPPLRERREDIPALIRAFLRNSGQGQEGGVLGIASEAVEYLRGLQWHGNVRELQGVVEAATAVASGVITLPDVREVVRRRERIDALWTSVPASSSMSGPQAAGLPSEPVHADGLECERVVFGNLTFRELTGRYFDYLLRLTGGRLTEVARRGGIAKATAFEWRKRFKNGGERNTPHSDHNEHNAPDGDPDDGASA